MASQFNFNIESSLPCSMLCKTKGLKDFISLCNYLKSLPYGRTKNRTDYLSVLKENKGTCSTKHAFIKQVAVENNINDIQLFIGIYKMNNSNTNGVGNVLKTYNLDYLPEAHTYLKVNNTIIDITSSKSSSEAFNDTLLLEVEISPKDIGDFKIEFHKTYLKQWILDENIAYSIKEIWKIRELCILALSK